MKQYQKPEFYEICLPSTSVLSGSALDVELDMSE